MDFRGSHNLVMQACPIHEAEAEEHASSADGEAVDGTNCVNDGTNRRIFNFLTAPRMQFKFPSPIAWFLTSVSPVQHEGQVGKGSRDVVSSCPSSWARTELRLQSLQGPYQPTGTAARRLATAPAARLLLLPVRRRIQLLL